MGAARTGSGGTPGARGGGTGYTLRPRRTSGSWGTGRALGTSPASGSLSASGSSRSGCSLWASRALRTYAGQSVAARGGLARCLVGRVAKIFQGELGGSGINRLKVQGTDRGDINP